MTPGTFNAEALAMVDPHTPSTRSVALFVAPDGGHGVQVASGIAAALPEFDWHFVAFTTVACTLLGSWGLKAHRMPWRHRNERPALDFFSTELAMINRGAANPPMGIARSITAMRTHLTQLVESLAPSIIVCFSADLALPRLTVLEFAQDASHVVIGLQPYYKRDTVIVHDWGLDWQRHLGQIDCLQTAPEADQMPLIPRQVTDEIKAIRRQYRGVLWLTRLERGIRAATGAVALDDPWLLLRGLFLRTRRWWRYHCRIAAAALSGRYVLVGVHRPAPSGHAPNWIELVHFAIEAAPPDCDVLVRLHPAEPLPMLDAQARAAMTHARVRLCEFDQPGSLEATLEGADAFFTLTSASGVEALRLGVPTFTLAPCMYARPGLAHLVSPKDAGAVRRHLEALQLVRGPSARVGEFLSHIERAFGAALPLGTSIERPARHVGRRIRELVARRCAGATASGQPAPARPHPTAPVDASTPSL